jgi:3',5'-cyclic AMP phosphodiesterase CpdA
VKIVALSDLHGYLPRLPAGDLLIVAGDLCPDRYAPFRLPVEDMQHRWFNQQARPWFDAAPVPVPALLTWGNHDWMGERLDAPTGDSFLVLTDASISMPWGPSGALHVWMSPWSNPFMNWAFMKHPQALGRIYEQIPTGVDIIVSHQPPRGAGDQVDGRGPHLGSLELLEAIRRVQPKLVICGHIHGGYGRYEIAGIPVYNVSVVNEAYQLVHDPTVIEFP